MESKIFEKYFIWFFLSGHTLYIPMQRQYGNFNFHQVLLPIPLILISVYTACGLYILTLQPYLGFQKFGFLWRIFSSTITLPCFSEIIANLIHRDHDRKIFELSITVSNELAKKRTRKVKFLHLYHRKILAIFSVAFLSSCARATFEPTIYSRYAHIFLMSMEFFKVLCVIYFLFYMALLSFLLTTLISHIELSISRNPTQNYLNDILFFVKYIHNRLWHIGKLINIRFSWTLMFILLEAFVNSANMVYWSFWYLTSSTENHLVVLRKYLRFFTFFLFSF